MPHHARLELEEKHPAARQVPVARILKAGLLTGTLDFVFAIALWSSQGVPAEIIPKSVASGLLGPAAFVGGPGIIALGTGLHFCMTTAMAAIYAAAAPYAVASRPFLAGSLYGAMIWTVMNKVIVPLSAAPITPPPTAIAAIDLLGHMLLVGLPIALVLRARRYG